MVMICRGPWLQTVGETLAKTDGEAAAIGCSALKRTYRDIIREGAKGPVAFLHLHAAKEVLAKRVATRQGHFMPPSLLDSQFAALEHLGDDELGCVIDISVSLEEVVTECEAYVRETADQSAHRP